MHLVPPHVFSTITRTHNHVPYLVWVKISDRGTRLNNLTRLYSISVTISLMCVPCKELHTYILIIVSQAHFDGFLCYSMFISTKNVIIVIRTPQACEELIRQTLFLLFERVVCLLKSGRIRKS